MKKGLGYFLNAKGLAKFFGVQLLQILPLPVVQTSISEFLRAKWPHELLTYSVNHSGENWHDGMPAAKRRRITRTVRLLPYCFVVATLQLPSDGTMARRLRRDAYCFLPLNGGITRAKNLGVQDKYLFLDLSDLLSAISLDLKLPSDLPCELYTHSPTLQVAVQQFMENHNELQALVKSATNAISTASTLLSQYHAHSDVSALFSSVMNLTASLLSTSVESHLLNLNKDKERLSFTTLGSTECRPLQEISPRFLEFWNYFTGKEVKANIKRSDFNGQVVAKKHQDFTTINRAFTAFSAAASELVPTFRSQWSRLLTHRLYG
jgi:hypothetical protein